MLAIDFAEPEASEEVTDYRDHMRQSSKALLTAIQTTRGTHWECDHHRTPVNTHTIAGVSQCRRCRRQRLRARLRLVAIRMETRRINIEIRAKAAQKRRREEAIGKLDMVAKSIALHRPGNGKLPATDLINGVAAFFGYTADDLRSRGRKKGLIHARAVVVEILHLRGVSFPIIGRVLGGRDHSTTINAHRNFPLYCEANSKVVEAYNKFKDAD